MASSLKPDVEAVNEVYKTARAQADAEMAKLREEIEGAKAEKFILGTIAKINYDDAHNKLLKYAVLYQYKQSKEYLKGGKSWEAFLESIGEDRRNVDRIFNDLSPLYDDFQGKLSVLANVPFNKIRYLGKSITGNLSGLEGGCIVIGDEKIPVDPEHTEQIEAAIDGLKQAHRAELAEKDATIKAKDRILEKKEKVVTNLENDLKNMTDKVKALKWAEGEKEFLSQLGRLQTEISAYIFRLDPESIFSDIGRPTPRMQAAYLETVSFLHRWFTSYSDTAVDLYGHPDLDTEWEPGMGGVISDKPSSKTVLDHLSPCEQCKFAHPECDKCCLTCMTPCNMKQACRVPENES